MLTISICEVFKNVCVNSGYPPSPPKTNRKSPILMGISIFKSLFFHCHVSFPGCILNASYNPKGLYKQSHTHFCSGNNLESQPFLSGSFSLWMKIFRNWTTKTRKSKIQKSHLNIALKKTQPKPKCQNFPPFPSDHQHFFNTPNLSTDPPSIWVFRWYIPLALPFVEPRRTSKKLRSQTSPQISLKSHSTQIKRISNPS